MKFLIVALCSAVLFGCKGGSKSVSLESQSDKVSYGIGLGLGKSLKRDSLTINTDALVRGINDGMGDSAKQLLSDEQVNEIMSSFNRDLMAKRMHAVAEKNLEEGEKFLAENKSKPGVVTLPSGLQYQVIVEGHGKTPGLRQTVIANYRGTLIDGEEFDGSEKHGGPAMFPVSGVIPGWTQALQLMKVGSKWKIFVPPDLAYGQHGAGNAIGPNATLIFDIELVGIK